MEIAIKLNETTVWLIQNALQAGAMMEAQALGHVHCHEYDSHRNEIDIHREMVVQYLALRIGIMRYWAHGESAEEKQITMRQVEEGTMKVVNTWNAHMKRIKGEA